MSIKEACNLVLQSTTLKNKNIIFFLDMGKPIKKTDRLIKKILITKNIIQKLKILLSGNKYNEKISKNLTLDNKNKTKIDKIFYIKDKPP